MSHIRCTKIPIYVEKKGNFNTLHEETFSSRAATLPLTLSNATLEICFLNFAGAYVGSAIGSYNLFIGTVIKETSTIITGGIAKYNRTLSFIAYSLVRLVACRRGKNNLFLNCRLYHSQIKWDKQTQYESII